MKERQRELVSLADAAQAFNAVMAMIAAQLDGLPGPGGRGAGWY